MAARTGRRKTTSRGRKTNQQKKQEAAVKNDILLIVLFAVNCFLFLCNFGMIGTLGDFFSDILFGLFGILSYIMPLIVFGIVIYHVISGGDKLAKRKEKAGIVLVFLVGIMAEVLSGELSKMATYAPDTMYQYAVESKSGGGVLFGSIGYFLYHYLDTIGTILLLLVVGIICIVAITEKSLIRGVKEGGRRAYETVTTENEHYRERMQVRREEREKRRIEEAQKRSLEYDDTEYSEDEEDIRILRMNKKVSGVMFEKLKEITPETEPKKRGRKKAGAIEEIVQPKEDIHEITLKEIPPEDEIETVQEILQPEIFEKAGLQGEELAAIHLEMTKEEEEEEFILPEKENLPILDMPEPRLEQTDKDFHELKQKTELPKAVASKNRAEINKTETPIEPIEIEGQSQKKYEFPPITLLKKPEIKGNGDSAKQLKETAARLQNVLTTFGVKARVTDISQGPAVTRYELQPEVGVKVSKIVGLADDIKLNLAATDIRIEAPIPGKAAVGIEVPNKENTAVALRELLEKNEFKSFSSNLAFCVGKDIGGNVVVADIAKMPHMLIAGATGSGKSVCINTIIMSLIYKAKPDEVKMIMIDPKVVELSVYNGIPHLLVPVVTDPKKAAGALHWGVTEMTDRYKKFADENVRDLKGYNKKMSSLVAKGEAEPSAILPQIVIIVDELADLMMVAPGEVEESICRLAQLARAAGIHLIIATQRPSVDVITGLIKANMPSRVAFAVSSGVDSRTILDMNGAEKLLGKGDMLFYPQGYPKPARIQGAFVSDKEVADVVDFLKNQKIGNIYNEDVADKMQNLESMASVGASSSNEKDEYFLEAGKFVIDKDKASIGLLQRVFKIGFNRAARIMDQLCEAGVVGSEEGTKPRKVLMSMEQFESYIEEYY